MSLETFDEFHSRLFFQVDSDKCLETDGYWPICFVSARYEISLEGCNGAKGYEQGNTLPETNSHRLENRPGLKSFISRPSIFKGFCC